MSASPPEPTGDRQRPVRYLLAALGVVCVGLGVLGAVLPGLPTTVFLIVASYLFARSCPHLEQKLIRTRIFGPYLRYLDGEPIPRRVRLLTVGAIWASVGISLGVLAVRGALAPWLGLLVLLLAGLGTLAVLVWRPDRGDSIAADAD